MIDKKVTILSLNTYGMPLLSPYPDIRLTCIANTLSVEDIQIINFQEVHIYYYLDVLKKRLAAFPYVSYKRSLLGPKGGLVTFSKFPIKETTFISFKPVKKVLSSVLSLFDIISKGILITELENSLAIFNTHLTANKDNDWSVNNRYYPIHRSELAQLSTLVKTYTSNRDLLLSGDFNIAKGSDLYKNFVDISQARDAFATDLQPTYHKEFLPKGRLPYCIDYVFYFSKHTIKAPQTSKMFQNKVKLKHGKNGYVSDHLALRATFYFT